MKWYDTECSPKIYICHQAVFGTGVSWGVKRYTTRCTSPVSMVSQTHSASWRLQRQGSAPPYGSMWLGKNFTFFTLLIMTGWHWSCSCHSDTVCRFVLEPTVECARDICRVTRWLTLCAGLCWSRRWSVHATSAEWHGDWHCVQVCAGADGGVCTW